MLSFLKDHPFAVEAHFESSIVLTFAVPKESLASLIPECLTLDTFEDKWAFIAIAMVQTKHLRPKGFPEWMGNDFFLIGYRVFVNYTTNNGKRWRGLYILKSETDKVKMSFFGNIFTHYNYTTTDITMKQDEDMKTFFSNKSNFTFTVLENNAEENVALPPNSPFKDWKIARRFAGPLPFTFSYNKAKKEVLIIEGVREHWQPKAIEIKDYSFDFLKNLPIQNPILANAFEIKNIPYYWKKGKKETWK